MPRPSPRENPWPRALGVSLVVHLVVLAIPLWPEAGASDQDDIVELVEYGLVELTADGVAELGEDAAPEEPDPAAGAPTVDEALLAWLPEPPEEVEPPAPEQPAELEHVQFDETSTESDVAPETNRIASKNVLADRDTRALTPVLERGPTVPAQLGAPGSVGSGSPQKTVEMQTESGRKLASDAEAVARKRAARESSDEVSDGERGAATAAGARSLAERDGGREAKDLEGRGARPESHQSAGRNAARVLGQVESAPLAIDGWEPHAVRVEPSLGQPAPSAEASEIETEDREDDDAVMQARAERRVRETGDDGEVELRTPQPVDHEEDAPAVADLDDQGEDLEEADRAWGGELVQERSVESGATGSTALTGRTATTSPLVLERTVDDGPVTQAEAMLHPHAHYMDEVRTGIEERWRELTPLEVRAMGLQGTAVVVLEIDGRGRVVTKTLTKRSGHSELDQLALASVPTRVKRPPEGAADPTFVYEMRFIHTDRWASAN